MKINKLISELARISTEQGNIEVVVEVDMDMTTISETLYDVGEDAAVIR